MEQIITTEKVPIKLWISDIEAGAMAQARNIANLPFVFKHVSIMADSHEGYGMPIGGVMATKGIVVPNAVGVDIGCGMSFLRTTIKADMVTKEFLKQVMGSIIAIPVGSAWRDTPVDDSEMPDRKLLEQIRGLGGKIPDLYESSKKQIGTLGGGNHFIELQKDEEGYLCVMIHSGSRNLGKKVADHYNNIAKELNVKYFSSVPTEYDLAFLPLDSIEGKRYLLEMEYCRLFAKTNRRFMMAYIKGLLSFWAGFYSIAIPLYEDILDVSHNYAAMENHFGENVMVHRKGAISAREEKLGIIPGSQGTKSYIVVGKGNADSFTSCSHGAGRRLSRRKARENLSLEAEIESLNKKGIIHSIRNKNDLDEAPSAYKNIEEVMENQKDLVDVKHTLEPIAVIKG